MRVRQSRFFAFFKGGWSALVFPKIMELTSSHLVTRKRHFPFFWIIDEETMNLERIASVRISRGLFWSTIIVESTGGSNTLDIRGIPKRTADAFRDRLDGVVEAAAGRNR